MSLQNGPTVKDLEEEFQRKYSPQEHECFGPIMQAEAEREWQKARWLKAAFSNTFKTEMRFHEYERDFNKIQSAKEKAIQDINPAVKALSLSESPSRSTPDPIRTDEEFRLSVDSRQLFLEKYSPEQHQKFGSILKAEAGGHKIEAQKLLDDLNDMQKQCFSEYQKEFVKEQIEVLRRRFYLDRKKGYLRAELETLRTHQKEDLNTEALLMIEKLGTLVGPHGKRPFADATVDQKIYFCEELLKETTHERKRERRIQQLESEIRELEEKHLWVAKEGEDQRRMLRGELNVNSSSESVARSATQQIGIHDRVGASQSLVPLSKPKISLTGRALPEKPQQAIKKLPPISESSKCPQAPQQATSEPSNAEVSNKALPNGDVRAKAKMFDSAVSTKPIPPSHRQSNSFTPGYSLQKEPAETATHLTLNTSMMSRPNSMRGRKA